MERDSVDPKSFNCPECRQDHFLSSDRNSDSAAQSRDTSDIVEIEEGNGNSVGKHENTAYNNNNNTIPSPTGPKDKDGPSEKEKPSDGGKSFCHVYPINYVTESNAMLKTNYFSVNIDTKSILSDSIEDYEIPTTAFMYIGKKIAEKEGGYDFLSDAGSEDYSHSYSVVDSPLSTPSSRTAPSGFHIVPLTIQQQASRGKARPKPSTFPTQNDSRSTHATSKPTATSTASTADDVANAKISSTASSAEGLDRLAKEEDGDDFVNVGSNSIYSDCGRPLRWN